MKGQERVSAARPVVLLGHLTGEGRGTAGDPVGHLGDELVDLGGDVGLAQQPVVVAVAAIDEVAVDAGQRHLVERQAPREPAAPRTTQVCTAMSSTWYGLTSVADLTSTMRATPPRAAEGRRGQHAAAAEGGFEQGEVAAPGQQAGGLAQGLTE